VADALDSLTVLTPATGVGQQPYAWLTTTGRRSGLPRTVELWFVLNGRTLYFLSGGGESSDWVRNAGVNPRVSVHLGSNDFAGTARRPVPGADEDTNARHAMATKYQGWREGRPLSSWAARSPSLAVDLDPDPAP
jgi:deazaflavin-dependent oxidoreductase (nitroreductase family)